MVEAGERIAERPEICPVSVEAAALIAEPIFKELSISNSILYRTAMERLAGLPIPDRLGIASILHPDTARSGIVVERWRLQEGRLPSDAVDEANPSQAITIWGDAANMPRLKIPEGADDDVIKLADRLQMRGGGPVVYAREEVAAMEHKPNTVIKVDGAANNANWQRLKTARAYAHAYAEASDRALEQPIIATVDPFRFLKPKERETVKEFAPDAKNELELMVDSAIKEGFVPEAEDNRYGARTLPDGSIYLNMKHKDGTSLLILGPSKSLKEDGNKQSGVFNGYQALSNHPELVSDTFKLDGSNLIQVTSTHYGAMAAMNNVNAVDELCVQLGSYRVLGDNQPARTPQAHLTEQALTTAALLEANDRVASAIHGALTT